MFNIGEKIKQLRKFLGMSQLDLAQKANLSNDYISKIEMGKVSNIGVEKFISIAQALERDPGELLGYYVSTKPRKLTISKKIAAIRKYKNMSQEDLAKKADMTLFALKRIEDEVEEPVSMSLGRISKALKVKSEALINKEPHEILGISQFNLIENYAAKVLPGMTRLDALESQAHFFDKDWMPQAKKNDFTYERTIQFEDDSAYVVQLGKDDNAMLPIGPEWLLYVGPEVELENGSLVLVGVKDSKEPGRHDSTGYRVLFREAIFEEETLILKAYNNNYPLLTKKKDDVFFVHKVFLCKPPGRMHKVENHDFVRTPAVDFSLNKPSLVRDWNGRMAPNDKVR